MGDTAHTVDLFSLRPAAEPVSGGLAQLRRPAPLTGSAAGRQELVDRVCRIAQIHPELRKRNVQFLGNNLSKRGLDALPYIDFAVKAVTVPSSATATHVSSEAGSTSPTASDPGWPIACGAAPAMLTATKRMPVSFKKSLRDSELADIVGLLLPCAFAFTCCPSNRAENAIMISATANHAFQCRLNLAPRWDGTLIEQGFGSQDHSATAIPTLRRLLLDECFLQRMGMIHICPSLPGW